MAGFVLEPVGALSDWLSVADSCKSFSVEASKSLKDAKTKEQKDAYRFFVGFYDDIATRCSGEEAVQIRIVSKLDRESWGVKGDVKTLRDGLADIKGIDNPGALVVGSEEFYAAFERHELAPVIVSMIAQYNVLDAKKRAGFFTSAQDSR